ncbi:hypothetical protein D0861_06088 [Hortaea werneckii]|uniref:K Homology domain-containing protein n=1 Tax=Hortaea werneckii TaxID=91943 RepID=A0A3M7FCD2_HORWE|nr:hypothetical protein D0861_06088 [Hortaea werneckii]
MADDDRPRRSRFDQAEPARKSRFDRRSASPSRKSSEPGRERSPVAKSVEGPAGGDSKKDAAAAAAAAAAKINASISAKKGIQHVDVPPIRTTQSPSTAPGAAKSPSQPANGGAVNDDIYQQDGDYIRDIEINDLRNRYTLTKGSTQKMIKDKTGADVTTRGNYYPDKSLATAANPPLYLHITSQTKDGLEKAVVEINELMKQELPNLIDERRFRRRDEGQQQPQQQQNPPYERDHLGRRKWPEERIPIDLEPIPGFNLRAQVVGHGGSYVKYIQQQTGTKVQIKGRGSGFMEHDTGRESDEQMYLHIAGPNADDVQRAKVSALELLGTVKSDYDTFKERGSRGSSGGGFHGDRYNPNGDGHRGGYGGYRDRHSSASHGGGSAYGGPPGGYNTQPMAAGYGAAGAQSPTAATQAAQGNAAYTQNSAEEQAKIQAWSQYYMQNPHEDPYAAYGGYAAMMASYMSNPGYYAQMASQQPQTPHQGMMSNSPAMGIQNGGGYGAPPPPPSEDQGSVPPPPPGAGSYSSVPPPPGL